MSYLDLYKKRVNAKGKTIYERVLNEQRERFYEYLSRTPNRQTIIIVEDNQRSPEYIVSILENKQTQDDKYFYILAPMEVPLHQGTLIEWSNSIWMVFVENETYKQTHFKGTLRKCNNKLKWVDKYGHLCSVDCYINGNTNKDLEYKGSANGFGSTFSFAYAAVAGNIEVILPKNAKTDLLKEQNRFILNEMAWELIGIDKYSYEGIIGVLLKRAMTNTLIDDIENSLAEANRLNTWHIDIANGLNHSLLTVGQEQKLQIYIYQNDNVVTENLPKLGYTISDDDIIDFNIDTLTITAKADGETTLRIYIDECHDAFTELSVEVGGIGLLTPTYTINGDATIMGGGNEYIYTAVRAYNGEEDILADFVFDKSDARMLVKLEKLSRNTCRLVTNCQDRYGKFKLRVYDGNEWNEKEITVKSLIGG